MDTKASTSIVAPLEEDPINELTHAFDDVSSATLSTISQLSTRCNDLLDSLRAIHLNTLCSHIENELSSALSLPSLDELKLDSNVKSSLRNNSATLIANGCVQSQIVNGAPTSPKTVKSDESSHLVNGSSQLVKSESPSHVVKEEHLNSQSLSPSRLPPRVIAELQRPEIAQFLDHSIALLQQVLKPSEFQVTSDATDANPKPQVAQTTNDNTVPVNSTDPVVNAPADSVESSAAPLPVSHEHRKDKHKHKHRQVNGELPESGDKHKHRKHKHKSRGESGQEASQTHDSPTHDSKQISASASAHKHSKHKRKHERHRERAPDGSSDVPDGVALAPPTSDTADGDELLRDAANSDGDDNITAGGGRESLSLAAQVPTDCTEDASANTNPVATLASQIPDVCDGAPQKPKRPRLSHETKSKFKRPVDGAVLTSTTQDSEPLPVSVPLPKASKKSKAKKTKRPKSSASACASDPRLFMDAADGSISPGGKPTQSSGECTSGKLVLKLKLSLLSVSDADLLGDGAESSTAAAAAADPTSAPPFAKPRAPLPSTSSTGSKKHTRWSLPPPLLPSDVPLHVDASDEEADSGAPSSLSKLPGGRPRRLRMPSTQHKASEYELQPPFARPRRAPFGIQSPSVSSSSSAAAAGSKAKCTSSVSCSSTAALCSPSANDSSVSVSEQLSSDATPSTISKMVSRAQAAALRTPPEKKRSRFFSSNNSVRVREPREEELPAKKARTLSYGAEQLVGEAEADADADAGGRCALSRSSAAALNGEGECEQSAAGDEQLGEASATAKKEPIPTPGYTTI